MRRMIAYCGLDCEVCEARLATVNDDNALRRKVAALWSQLNQADITPEMINCTGCRLDGVKTPFCEALCPIRQCAREKKYDTCGDCPEMETCSKINLIHVNNPDARARLMNDPAKVAVRTLVEGETEEALALAWKVFQVYEAPVYTADGTEEFRRSLKDETFLAGIRWYGAFDGERLVGMVGIRPDRCHICLFFVDGQYHRRGIGTRLFQRIREDFPDRTITLNSSPYALPFYKHLGFTATDGEQIVNGLRFTPMECRVPEREKGL